MYIRDMTNVGSSLYGALGEPPPPPGPHLAYKLKSETPLRTEVT